MNRHQVRSSSLFVCELKQGILQFRRRVKAWLFAMQGDTLPWIWDISTPQLCNIFHFRVTFIVFTAASFCSAPLSFTGVAAECTAECTAAGEIMAKCKMFKWFLISFQPHLSLLSSLTGETNISRDENFGCINFLPVTSLPVAQADREEIC